jgi:hypothetical protein
VYFFLDKNIDRGRIGSRLLWCMHMEWKETRSPSHPFAPATTLTHPSPWRSSAGRPTERCQKHSPEIQQKKCSHCWVLSRALHSPPLSLFTLSKVMVISNTSTIITLCQRTRSKQLNCHREALPPRVPCTVVVLLSYPLEGARSALPGVELENLTRRINRVFFFFGSAATVRSGAVARTSAGTVHCGGDAILCSRLQPLSRDAHALVVPQIITTAPVVIR